MKLAASRCNCGFIFGRSADGTQTELRCSKCGAEVEYTVENDSVTVRMIRLSAKADGTIEKICTISEGILNFRCEEQRRMISRCRLTKTKQGLNLTVMRQGPQTEHHQESSKQNDACKRESIYLLKEILFQKMRRNLFTGFLFFFGKSGRKK